MAHCQQFDGTIKFAVQVQEHPKMILSDPDGLWTFLNSKSLCFLEVNEGVLVVLGFVLTQSQQSPSRTELGSQADNVLQGFNRIPIACVAEINQAQVTPALLPIGIELERLLVIANGVGDISPIARRWSFPGKFVERSGAAGSFGVGWHRFRIASPEPANRFREFFRACWWLRGSRSRDCSAGRLEVGNLR